MEIHYKEFVISDDHSSIDQRVVLDFLSKSYWANQRPPERIIKSIETSVCYGVYHQDEQVGFARVITDGATMYYLCDIFVLEPYRGQGIGKKLVDTIVNAEEFEWMTGVLGTLDAHSLYEQFGFSREQERYMKRLPQGREESYT